MSEEGSEEESDEEREGRGPHGATGQERRGQKRRRRVVEWSLVVEAPVGERRQKAVTQ